MTLIKHLNKFKEVKSSLIIEKSNDEIRFIITDLMKYLEKNYLLDKNYLSNSYKFLKAEKDLALLKEAESEMLLSYLTMIYRIEFIDGNSDAYLLYYKNGMLTEIMIQLIKRFEILIKGVI